MGMGNKFVLFAKPFIVPNCSGKYFLPVALHKVLYCQIRKLWPKILIMTELWISSKDFLHIL